MAAVALLLLGVGTQLALSSGVELPSPGKAQSFPALPEQPAQQAYNAIMAHPIFAPDRAPPPVELDETGNLNGVEVLGTAIAGADDAAALLRDAEGNFQRLKVGGEVDGWKLVSIEREQLVFDRNGERRTLDLDAARLKAQASTENAKGQGPGMAASTGNSMSDTNDDSDSDDNDDDQ